MLPDEIPWPVDPVPTLEDDEVAKTGLKAPLPLCDEMDAVLGALDAWDMVSPLDDEVVCPAAELCVEDGFWPGLEARLEDGPEPERDAEDDPTAAVEDPAALEPPREFENDADKVLILDASGRIVTVKESRVEPLGSPVRDKAEGELEDMLPDRPTDVCVVADEVVVWSPGAEDKAADDSAPEPLRCWLVDDVARA
ncbi:hypothetical protein M409DRAFT_20815 [Zasmidium cellare ATCC 36951]|uniref:Uncharacterized protein n=1 Tax=Zasmidium cellare ATCC 36951 TaxID=1080233 RepID=A0A6A6CSP9_ZASCE|nr:uncharacterized protein M409DRAFT_20815 [Zasmidium cellare ATCC 36951]KAF2168799.1 hypothetical protein M409DRAFT_20815 [Zasmidium cellare ATCC 36951]